MKELLNHLLRHPLLPVFYHDDAATCIEVINACYQGGIRVFEFVNRGVRAQENFEALLRYRNENFPDLKLGVGTIKDAATASRFIATGADFLVSPLVKAEIAEVTLKKGVLWIPGCMTPTEIGQAADLGAPMVKLFPGETLGRGFLKAVKPLFPEMLFMPTGGVNPDRESISDWFGAGANAVGLGSRLFEKPEGAGDYGWLSERIRVLTSGFPDGSTT